MASAFHSPLRGCLVRPLFVARLLRRVEKRGGGSFTDSFSRNFDCTSTRKELSEDPSGQMLEEGLKKLE
jgi:hypothetical protein